MQCSHSEANIKFNSEFSQFELGRKSPHLVFVRDDGIYELTCPVGHKSATVLQDQKFEVLFDIGARAILDGYYREAVSSFAASLERFYEFALMVLFVKNDPNLKLFTQVWKHVPYSERQYGAFVLLWAHSTREDPRSIIRETKDWVKFRNDVIHKGRIPSNEDAVAYGEVVLKYIRQKMDTIRCRFSDELESVLMWLGSIKHKQAHDLGVQVTYMSRPTIIGLSVAPSEKHHRQSLMDHLAQIQRSRQIGLE